MPCIPEESHKRAFDSDYSHWLTAPVCTLDKYLLVMGSGLHVKEKTNCHIFHSKLWLLMITCMWFTLPTCCVPNLLCVPLTMSCFCPGQPTCLPSSHTCNSLQLDNPLLATALTYQGGYSVFGSVFPAGAIFLITICFDYASQVASAHFVWGCESWTQ